MGLSSRWKQGPPPDTKDQAQLTSDFGVPTETPLRHKDSYVAVATVPEVLHSNGNAPAGEVVLEAVPAVERGQRSGAPRGAWQPGCTAPHFAHIPKVNATAHLVISSPSPGLSAPPGTHTMATLLPSMTIWRRSGLPGTLARHRVKGSWRASWKRCVPVTKLPPRVPRFHGDPRPRATTCCLSALSPLSPRSPQCHGGSGAGGGLGTLGGEASPL